MRLIYLAPLLAAVPAAVLAEPMTAITKQAR